MAGNENEDMLREGVAEMKVVALISGGKDSTFNMMKCVENGHEIVALANLYPVDAGFYCSH